MYIIAMAVLAPVILIGCLAGIYCVWCRKRTEKSNSAATDPRPGPMPAKSYFGGFGDMWMQSSATTGSKSGYKSLDTMGATAWTPRVSMRFTTQ